MTEPALIIDGDRARVPASAFELDGFRRWAIDELPDGVQASFVDGEVLIDMSPESLESHSKVKTAITIALGRISDEEGLGEAYADGVLFTHAEARVSTEPDFTFVSFESIEAGRVRYGRRSGGEDFVELEGTPDLVVEVVSDASRRKDLVLLREAYARAGIPEYWLVDARGDGLRFSILRLEAQAYVESAPAGAPQPSRVFARCFVLTREPNRVGRWHYRLAAV